MLSQPIIVNNQCNSNQSEKVSLYLMQALNEPVGGCIHVPPFKIAWAR